MSLILDGSLGVTTPNTITSAAATPLTIQSGGVTAMTVDTSQNVGIGTSSPGYAVDVQRSSTDTQLNVQATGANYSSRVRLVGKNGSTDNEWNIIAAGAFLAGSQLRFTQGTWTNTPAMLLDSSGNLLLNRTTQSNNGQYSADFAGTAKRGAVYNNTDAFISSNFVSFSDRATIVGSITQNGASTVAYNTSSDYRLKNTIAPMTGALDKVALLKPCTYKWNTDGSDGQGFIAHELAEVEPGCVSGEKDAVDAEGKPQYQGIDTSFLVATLTAALQEAHGLIKNLEQRVAVLEAA